NKLERERERFCRVKELPVIRLKTFNRISIMFRRLAVQLRHLGPARSVSNPTCLASRPSNAPENVLLSFPILSRHFSTESVAIFFVCWQEEPAVVKSYYDKRIVGCPGVEGEDEHDVVWFWLEKGKPHECPVCSQYFVLEVVGPGGSPDGHSDDDDHHH
ncbi:cytochrome c oxidase subunit 5b, partial [Striga asiatica]